MAKGPGKSMHRPKPLRLATTVCLLAVMACGTEPEGNPLTLEEATAMFKGSGATWYGLSVPFGESSFPCSEGGEVYFTVTPSPIRYTVDPRGCRFTESGLTKEPPMRHTLTTGLPVRGMKTVNATIIRSASTALSLILLTSACTFSDLQSARLVGPGRFEVTPGYSSTSVSAEGESEKLQSHFGIRVATGLASWVDWRLRYEYISPVDSPEPGLELSGLSFLGTGPKVRLVEDRLALYTPVGFAFGGASRSSPAPATDDPERPRFGPS